MLNKLINDFNLNVIKSYPHKEIDWIKYRVLIKDKKEFDTEDYLIPNYDHTVKIDNKYFSFFRL